MNAWALAAALSFVFFATLGQITWVNAAASVVVGGVLAVAFAARSRSASPIAPQGTRETPDVRARDAPHPEAPAKPRRLSLLRRLFVLPRLALSLTRAIVRGTWLMIAVTVGRRPWSRLGVVEVPVGDRSELGITVTALAAGLSPGTVFLDVDRDRGVMRFHVIDTKHRERFLAELDHFYRDYQSHFFP